jgi:predicted HTH transcriptional regulator
MNIPVIPKRLGDWTIGAINSLIKIRDIESETFDFKKDVSDDLENHICAMANLYGGYIVLGIEEIKSSSDPHIIAEFKKVGFRAGKEDDIGKQISNSVYKIEPFPRTECLHIHESQ